MRGQGSEARGRRAGGRGPGAGMALLLVAVLAGCGGRATPEKEYQAGLADLRAGRLTEGKARIEKALERAPEASFAAEAQNWLGRVNRELGQANEAIAHFEYATRLAPAAFDPVYNLGCLALESGDMSRGISLLRKAADLDDRDTRALLHIGEWTTRNGRWDWARRMYYEALKRDSQSTRAATGLGRVELLEGNLAKAETLFMQALEGNKNDPAALYNLGVLHSLIDGHGEQSREYFRQYLEIDPTGERAAAAADRIGGQVIEQTSFQRQVPAQPRMTAGVLWAQAQQTLKSGDAEAAYLQAMSALAMAREGGDAAQAAEILRRALDVFPDRAAIHLEAGEYWLEQDEPRQAHEALLKAQALEPENPMVLFELSKAATRLAEYDTAVISLRKLVKLEPGNPDALWNLAGIYGDKLGMSGRGISLFREFERRFPTDPRAEEVTARVTALEAAAEALPPLEP